MTDIPAYESSDDIFADLGFTSSETAELSTKSALIDAI
jgi:hypothetical protein